MSELTDKIRAEFLENDEVRDAGLTVPEEIECFRDIVYGTDEKWQSLDVYRPKALGGKENKIPVIVSVHGGGWVYGDKERYQFYCMDLAKRGFAVVNFSYRLAPEHKFPDPLIDMNLVMEWVAANADAYGLDLANLFAVGDSAGAHLLGLYACMMTNEAYALKFDFTVPKELSFKAIALNCGQYEVRLDATTDETMRGLMQEFLPEQGTPREQRLTSVNRHITESFPPTFFMTAPKDFLLPQAQVLQMALVLAQVNFTYRFYCDPKSSLGHVFHLDVRSEWAAKCNDDECDFFKSHM